MKITIIAVGKMKNRTQIDLLTEYANRLKPSPVYHEIPHGKGTPELIKDSEANGIEKHLVDNALTIILDERGKNLSSMALSTILQTAMNDGKSHVQAIIGGAEGLHDRIRARGDVILAFGKLTWPHMLARIMLTEQLYRAQQIIAGHPYHREG